MKIYILVLVTILISGCSNLQTSTPEKVIVKQANTNQVCKIISRHRSSIKQCRSLIQHQ
jgi:PBP1b-binding outer membrane lipoprotein LpoB